jgi:large subunit ribosomal protein L4
VLVSDDVVFTQGALDAFLAGPAQGQVRQGAATVDRQPTAGAADEETD